MNLNLPNNITKLKQVQEKALLSILDNGKFLSQIAQTTKMARKYYNQNKFWCSNINMRNIEGGNTTLRLLLTRDMGCSNTAVETANLNHILKYGPSNKTEAMFYYYYKHSDFFIDVLSALKQAFQSYSNNRYYCKYITLPSDLKWDGITTHKDRNFYVTGVDLIRLYGSTHFVDMGLLQTTLVSQRKSIKLPMPVLVDSLNCKPDLFIPNSVGNYLFRNNY